MVMSVCQLINSKFGFRMTYDHSLTIKSKIIFTPKYSLINSESLVMRRLMMMMMTRRRVSRQKLQLASRRRVNMDGESSIE